MITFDINGAIVEFDEKMDNYNSIRKTFKNQAEENSENFKNYCLENLSTLKDLSEKSLEIGIACRQVAHDVYFPYKTLE